MYQAGHYGAALAVYAPIGFGLLAVGLPDFALLGGAVMVGGAMLPDMDIRVPFLKHRGLTHTIWFALAVGIGLGAIGGAIGANSGVGAAVALGGFGFLLGTLTVGSHLLADVLTPMGIRPFEPLRDDEYSLELTRAANPIANYLLLALGIGAAILAFVAGQAITL